MNTQIGERMPLLCVFFYGEFLNYETILTYSETRARIVSYLPYFKENLLQSAEFFHSSLYVGTEHITGLVNTYYISGSNVDTVSEVTFDMNTWGANLTTEGDGTVTNVSSTLSQEYMSNNFYKDGITHTELITDDEIIEFIDELLNGIDTAGRCPNIYS